MDKNTFVLIGIVGALFLLFQQNKIEIVVNSDSPTPTFTATPALTLQPTWTPFYVSQPPGGVAPVVATVTPTGVSLNEALGSSQNPFLGEVTIVP